MKEDPTPYQPQPTKKERVQPLDAPDCIGVKAALARASAKAVARARAAGLEPVVRSREEADRDRERSLNEALEKGVRGGGHSGALVSLQYGERVCNPLGINSSRAGPR